MAARCGGARAYVWNDSNGSSHCWCDEPRLGEADRPGPPSPTPWFDDPEFSFWDEDPTEEPWQQHCSELDIPPDDWPAEEQVPAAVQSEQQQQQQQPQPSEIAAPEIAAPPGVMEEWLCKHQHDEFVPVKNPRPTKTSKFLGLRVGWVFKTGEQGLGYYRDKPCVSVVSLYDLLVPAHQCKPVKLSLQSLIQQEQQQQHQQHPQQLEKHLNSSLAPWSGSYTVKVWEPSICTAKSSTSCSTVYGCTPTSLSPPRNRPCHD